MPYRPTIAITMGDPAGIGAEVIVKALFPQEPNPPVDARTRERIRQAVLDKNFYWFHRYRTTDGYSTYGDRAFLRFTDGQSNYEVVQRELEVLDIQTANRDKAVWAVARGGEYKPETGRQSAEGP